MLPNISLVDYSDKSIEELEFLAALSAESIPHEGTRAARIGRLLDRVSKPDLPDILIRAEYIAFIRSCTEMESR